MTLIHRAAFTRWRGKNAPSNSRQRTTLLSLARLLIAETQKERAAELLRLVIQHPASYQTTKDDAERLLAQLRTELPPQVFAVASEQATVLKLEDVVAEFLGEAQATPPWPMQVQPLPEPLTQRELEVLRLVADGLSNAEIAQQLYLAVATVKVHTRNIYGKLGVSSRTQAVLQAQKLNLL